MELFYYKDPKLNFGDDLNAVLWPEVLSEAVRAADDLVVIGIGSILSEEWVGKYANSEATVVVLGSGTSYDRPPHNMRGWHVLAVRGPLTARLIGKPEAAVTDGAILLADAPKLIGAARPRTDIVFMPHHKSVGRTPWEQIATEAGMRYVTPQQPVADVLRAFASAKLVVTEAMHGAIVADTLRIPWVPVIASPGIDEFKWRDWCLSMDVPFSPIPIAAGHAVDVRNFRAMRRALAAAGLSDQRFLEASQTKADIDRYFERRFSLEMKRTLLRPLKWNFTDKVVTRAMGVANPAFRRQAVDSLQAAANSRSFLSTVSVFKARLGRMREVIDQLEGIVAGRP